MIGRLANALKGRKRVLVLAVLLVAAAAVDAAYYAVVCRPVAAEAARLESSLAEIKNLNARVAGDLRYYESFDEGRKRLEEFKSMLSSRSEYVDVLKTVYELAQKDGMRGKSFGAQTSALRQVGGLEQLSFSLPVTGNYRDVRKFIYHVETSDLFLNIDSLGLKSGEGGVVSLSMGLSTYVRS